MKAGWQMKKLGDICQTGSGGTPLKSRKEFYEGGMIPWLMSGEVSQGEVLNVTKFITKKGLENSSAKIFPRNTVLVAMYGATAGETGILRFEAATNQAVCGVFPNEYFVPEFLFYCLMSRKDELIAQAAGNAQPNISQIKIRNTKVPLPPLPEQQRIVAILDEAFEGIATAATNAKKNLNNARELFESTLQSVFSNKGEGWQAKNLGGVCLIKPPKNEARKNLKSSDLVSFVPMESLGIGQKYFDVSRLRALEEVAGSYTYFADGDVLLAKITPCFENGKIGIARNLKNGVGFGSSEYIVLRSSAALHNEFLYYFLSRKAFREEGAKRMTGAVGHKRVAKEFIENTFIPFPPLPEQQRMVSKLDELSTETKKLEAIYQQKLTALDELKKSILHQAFSGQLS